jgi:hypothetical protein
MALAASCGLGLPVAGSARSTANMRPLPRTSATVLRSPAAALSPSMMIAPQAAAFFCRSWEST